MTSALIKGQNEDKELNVLSNQLTGAINNSMSIKIDDKSHNVAGINKVSNM
jgi:hypothetical protein